MSTKNTSVVQTEAKPQRNVNDVLRNVFRVIVALLLVALLVLGVIWLTHEISREVQTDNVSGQPVASYICNAVAIGTPVSTEGKCTFCTVNYSKPGEVFIAGETAIEYQQGAWVFQYNTGNFDGFKACIKGQDFMSDPNYQPIWK